MLPKGWKVKTVSEILERVVDPITPEPDKEYRQIGIRSHGKGIFHKESVTGKSLGNKRVFNVHPDCFVVNIVFAWEQAVAKTTISEVGMIASHRFPMYKPKGNLCDVDYITYLFKTKRGKYLLELASPGGAGRNKTLGQKEFSRLEILTPPTAEQTKIAKILSAWDKAIETVEALIENSKKQKKALMRELLTGKKRFPGFNKKFIRLRIGDIAKIDEKSLGSKTPSDYDFRYISLSDVSLGEISGNLVTYKYSYSPSRARRVVKDGDILMATVRPNLQAFARITLANSDCIASTGFAVLSPKDKFHSGYLYHYLFSPHITGQINAIVVGSNYPAINSSDVKALAIHCPEYDEQSYIAELLDRAEELYRLYKKKLDLLKIQKQALTLQLLSGRRRVANYREVGQ